MFQLTPTVRNLLIANVVVFFITLQLGSRVGLLGMYPFESSYFRVWQPLTHMFMHGGLGHLFSNMLGLMVFGPMLEQRWGARRFLTYWLICGLGAGLLYNGVRSYELNGMQRDITTFQREPTGVHLMDFVDNHLKQHREAYETVATQLHRTPNDPQLISGALASMQRMYEDSISAPMVGASGALFGVMLAFAFFFPNTVLVLFPIPIPVKAKYLIGFYGLYEFYTGVHRVPGDNVAHFAHLGGMLVGLILLLLWQRDRTRLY
ncbi:rhomboid family intramembrane serine protease [Hymenobacter weizhouensis]|uniref:rhomboid family intramembrane serine protease n=1 Tax=Hymenobacter sp. YIM 151500-1 TaxID=2987689 RepID=UPI002227092E|nr:rhomboid family intramembrane serine protease [Hymenobacter sp. YIM 151500-1]UYZ65151.1 rhomboid family intramembrane serine protease [Hymenobacter sp. YIM 151500-1]